MTAAAPWRRWLAQAALLCAVWAAGLLFAAAWWVGADAWRALSALGSEIWLALLGLFAVNHALRFVRWHWMLHVEGHRVPVARDLAVFLAGLALLPTPAKAGVTVRSLLLLRDGVPAEASLAAHFSERLFDLLGLIALGALVLGSTDGSRWAIALGAGTAGVAAVRIAPGACRALATRLGSERARRALAWALHFFEHASRLVSSRYFLPFLLLGMAANACTGVLLWLAVSSAGLDFGLLEANGMIGVSHLSGSLSMLPGGLGGFEAAMIAQLRLFGIPAAAMMVALVLVRIATVWGSVAVGLPFLLALVPRAKVLAGSVSDSPPTQQ